MIEIIEFTVMALFGLGFGLICIECASLFLDEMKKKDVVTQKEFARRIRERKD